MTAAHHRWVMSEPDIPFDIGILYEDADIVVIDKPHFVPTTPRGMWYAQSALIRLRETYHDDSIIPAHRLDRATAGVVVFVRTSALRGAFQTMFQERRARKTYECIAPCLPVGVRDGGAVRGVRMAGSAPDPSTGEAPLRDIVAQARRTPSISCIPGVLPGPTGTVAQCDPPQAFPLVRRSHITKLRGVLQAFEEPGVVNAETRIDLSPDQTAVVCDAAGNPRGRVALAPLGLRAYTLTPSTGKTHQLRVHMNALGLPMLGDDMYPRVIDRPYDDFGSPLQLVARELRFADPRDGAERVFRSRIPLSVPCGGGQAMLVNYPTGGMQT